MKIKMEKLMRSKKSFVFILDMVVAITVVAFVLLTSLYYVTRSDVGSTANIQMIRTGYDVIASLDYENVLQTFNKNTIEDELYNVLPVSYHYRLEVTRDTGDSIIIETSEAIPTDRFVASGKRFFVSRTRYGQARFWIWVK